MSFVGPVKGNLCIYRLPRTSGPNDFVDASLSVVFGFSGMREVCMSRSAILADLAMRGFAISFLTLARIASPVTSSAFLGLLDFL